MFCFKINLLIHNLKVGNRDCKIVFLKCSFSIFFFFTVSVTKSTAVISLN